ncbi:MAG: DUF6338 family protein [Planctomycetaceae bacterium]|jgi:hypothetical protein|nr:DUF6338 family protein [Planctomycetaceae bacterium]
MLDSILYKLDLASLLFIVLFIVFPGLVAMRVYRLLIPTKSMDWQNAIHEASFWGTINVLFVIPLIVVVDWLMGDYIREEALFVLPVLTAIIMPVVWRRLHNWSFLRYHLISPQPSAWDYYFSLRKHCFVLVHLKNGQLIGGYFGDNSLASAYPEKMSIYLEQVIYVNGEGAFGDAITDSLGIIIDSDTFDYIEVFEIPKIKEK